MNTITKFASISIILLAVAAFSTESASSQVVITDVLIDTGPGDPFAPGDAPILFPPEGTSTIEWRGQNFPDGTSVLNFGLYVGDTRIIDSQPPVDLMEGTVVDIIRVGEAGARATFNVPLVPTGPGGPYSISVFIETTTPTLDASTADDPFSVIPGNATPAPSTGEGTFDRPIEQTGVNTAIWNGGSITQLGNATAAEGGISITVFVEGQATVFIPGAPAFVNAAFNQAFPDGTVPAGTIVLVVK